MVVDGESKPHTLMQLVKETLKANPNNSVIGFKDNSRWGSACVLDFYACFMGCP